MGAVAIHDDILADCIPRADIELCALPGDPEPRDVRVAHVHPRIVLRNYFREDPKTIIMHSNMNLRLQDRAAIR